jgi:hypothetical protein
MVKGFGFSAFLLGNPRELQLEILALTPRNAVSEFRGWQTLVGPRQRLSGDPRRHESRPVRGQRQNVDRQSFVRRNDAPHNDCDNERPRPRNRLRKMARNLRNRVRNLHSKNLRMDRLRSNHLRIRRTAALTPQLR